MATSITTTPASGAEHPFAVWQEAMRRIETSNPDDSNEAEWQIEADAEDAIFADKSPTLANVERKLWIALQHSLTSADEHAAVVRTDLAPLLAKGDALDWNGQLVVSAIQTLRAIGGRA